MGGTCPRFRQNFAYLISRLKNMTCLVGQVTDLHLPDRELAALGSRYFPTLEWTLCG